MMFFVMPRFLLFRQEFLTALLPSTGYDDKNHVL